MSRSGAVSPLTRDINDAEREDSGVVVDEPAWDRMMRPFDQDEEEEKEKEAQDDSNREAQRAKYIRPGYNPTQQEIDEHMVSHLPYRVWCAHCIRGRPGVITGEMRRASPKRFQR